MTAPPPKYRGLARLADVAYRRRGRVVLAWIATLVVVSALAPAIAGEFEADYSTPSSESKAAADLVEDTFPGGGQGDTIEVVWRGDKPEVQGFLNAARSLEGIESAEPVRDGRNGIHMTRLALDRPGWDVPTETGEKLLERAEPLGVELGGNVISEAQEAASPEVVGLFAAIVILLIAFGSVVAAGLPVVTALFGLGLAASLIGIACAVVDVPEWAPAVASLLGLGVGIDYSLLILTRFRAALAAGRDPHDAVVEAVSTAGRSVLVAGLIVVVSVLGLFVMGISYMNGVAVVASLSVLVVMGAALTLLPAVLGYVRERVDRLHIPGLGRGAHTGERAARWSRAVQRRPLAAALLATAALVALTLPVLGMRLGFPDAGNDRDGTTTRAAYELVADGFGPGFNGPLLVAGDAATVRADLAALREVDGVQTVSEPRLNRGGDTALVTVVPRSSPQDAATEDVVTGLRAATDAKVGGQAASFIDQSAYMSDRLPLFVGAVVGVSFLLLLFAFRAPLIALKAGVMNLLSVGAAYGVVALVAEGGAVGSLVGIDTDTPVPPFIPVIMFAILFGLSMDYEVFLLSRVREEFSSLGDTGAAVTAGLAKTARVITAAAAIMVAVFLAFVFSPETFLKLMGVGMAAAIFVDATIVRMVLVPAVMQLLGRANWWIPQWLDRALPRARGAEAA